MKGIDLWKEYCSFNEKDFSEQIEYNNREKDKYFEKWKKTDLAKILGRPREFSETVITKYSDYPMLHEFGCEISNAIKRIPRKQRESIKDYYDRISVSCGSKLSRYMAEPFHLCMKTTGTTGQNKWFVHGETFWKNLVNGAISTAVISCSSGWGETKARVGDKGLNINAPVPHLSGWAAWATKTHFNLIPPIEVTDRVKDIKEIISLVLKLIQNGEKISLAGGIGSLFYMICKYFVEPEEFYGEYYRSMGFGLRKILLYLKLLQFKLSKKEIKKITDFIPLKGIMVGGVESKLYIDFFKEEFGLEPLHAYGATETGTLMRGDPDRKTDLVPDLRANYFEFQTELGEVKNLDELKKGNIYDLVVTPFGSILFRYDLEDLLRVVDFRDDGMPIFAIEGRNIMVLRLYGYSVTPNVVVQALSKAGLRTSDKWAVAKLLKPKERLHFLFEKTWSYSEREAEKLIFNSLIETENTILNRGHTLRDYITEFRVKDPSEVIKVEYLRKGAFLRYAMIKSKDGSPIGQYKPPKVIPPDKMEIYETLRNV